LNLSSNKTRVWHLSFLIYWFSIRRKQSDTLCHYTFISFYVFLSYFSISSSIFKILGGIFIFNASIIFNTFSLTSVLTPILFFPILIGIANTKLNSFKVVCWNTQSSLFVCNRHQRPLFDFAVVTIWLNEMIVSLSFGIFGDFDVHRGRIKAFYGNSFN